MLVRAILIFLAVTAEAAFSLGGDHVLVNLVRGPDTPEGIVLGVEFAIEPDWHVYWKNPGDSGTAPKIQLEIAGGTAGPIRWPAPERIRLGDLTNYGYGGRVIYSFVVRPEPGAKEIKVKANLEWLVCQVECLPGFGKLEGTFPVTVPAGAVLSQLNDSNHPLPETASPFTLKVIARDADGIALALQSSSVDLSTVREIDLFPLDGELFTTKAPSFQLEQGRWIAKIPFSTNARKETASTTLLLKVREDSGWRAFELALDLSPPSVPWRDVLNALMLAFLGGMFLNLMPCVFPVLSIKVLSLIRESESSHGARRGGWLYGAGVTLTFLALAGALLALRAGGEQLGWGFQLQSPRFVLAMALLFFLIGLNFLGVFEIGYGAMRVGGSLQSIPMFNSSFGTGVLATLVATPCTAPFMGTALGVSLLLPWWGSLAIFAALGIGMAAPFVLLCHFPAALRALPRPGPWMEHLKQFFAFPLFATTVWLGWVLVQQTGAGGFLILGLCTVGLGLASWLARAGFRQGFRLAGLSIGFLSFAAALVAVTPAPTAAETKASSWQAFDAKKISDMRASGSPVFVDFTASWCLTCQWNKKSVLETKPVLELFEKNGVKLVRADWTDRDPEITKALAGYGRNSVPLYVFLPPTGEAIILPELISRGDIEKLFPTGTTTAKESQK